MFRFIKNIFLKKKIRNAVKTLRAFDALMIRAKMSRFERRAFWKEFYQNESVREQLYKQMQERLGITNGGN